MSDFMEIDPHTGIKTQGIWNENDQEYTLVRSSDVEPVLDFAAQCRNELGVNRDGIKRNWWLYASIPAIVIVQMRAKGINVFDKNDEARMFAELNTHYPHLKTTTGNHGGKVKIHG
jgi:hypothetical protein